MADYVKKIRTSNGDKQIDYEALANLPTIPLVDMSLTNEGAAADAKATGDAINLVNTRVEEKVENPLTGVVGQILEIETVDESGKPKTYKAVNKPSGGGEVTDEQISNAVDNYMTAHPFTETDPTVPDWAKHPEKPRYTAEEVGADASGTAESKVSEHNVSDTAHNDIRLLIDGLTTRLNALADSDDTTFDQMSEVVAYIKSNKSLIDAITTSKVNVSDIIDNLTTNASNKPLSAAQGVALKTMIDGITIPTTLPNPNALTFTGAVTGSYDGSSPIEINIPGGGGTDVAVDTTLSVAGQAADAKATGDAISSLSEDIPTVDDISDMGFVLKDAISYMEDEISALKAQGVQQVPLFANSTKECTDTTKMYVLPDGYVYAYLPEPAYTNILDTVGYQENMRISVSSGYTEKENEGSDLTGYIPFKANDIIRLKNITLPILETGYGAIMYTYNSSREGVGSVQLNSSYADNGYNRAVYDDAGNLIQFTLHEYYYNETHDNAEGYLRINAADINKASIITVNEEITDDTTTYAWQNTGHAFVPADYEDWIVELEEITSENKENIENVTKRVSALESSQSDAQLPDYCVMHLEEKIALIRQAMEGAGRDKSSFLYYTDAHWTYNSQMSPALLKYLHQNTPINKIIYGGDIVDNESDVRSDMSYLYEWRAAIRGLPNHHSVKGNHDDGNVTDKRFDEKYIYAFLMAAEESSDIVRGGDFYYYIDDVCEKTRYLYLDTGYFSVGDDQVQFFVNALNDTPDGWHIVAIAHVWFLYANTATPTVGSVPEYCQKLLSLFDAYNNRNNGSVTMNSSAISYDFTDASGKVAFCVGGHTHADMDFTSDGGIPVIITETDSKHVRSGLTCTEGTITEFSVNAIIADYDANEIHVIRIGRGEDRTVSMTN